MTRIELHELWQKRMNDFETSGLTGTQWCADQKIPLSRFQYWRRKLRSDHHTHEGTNHWMTVNIENTSPGQDVLFIHFGQAKIELHVGFDPDLFAEAVRVLRAL